MGIFKDAIAGKNHIKVIAEIKRRSPSHGDFPLHSVPELLAAYQAGGASAISVVTEGNLFGGNLALLKEVRRSTHLPILRKDFITRRHDVEESAESDANAVLLIASMLEPRELRELADTAKNLGLDVVAEIHDDTDLSKIIDLKDAIIGINNRNLQNMKTDVHHAEKFIARIAPSRTIVAESAFLNAGQLTPYRFRADAVLIGTALLTAQNPEHALITFTSL